MSTSSEFNPRLRAWEAHVPEVAPGAGSIERPDAFENIVHQTRSREPDEYELCLALALENAFATGAEELGDVLRKLNDAGVRDQSGLAWTEASFRESMNHLGY